MSNIQSVYKPAIWYTVRPAGRIDPCYPQGAKISFLLFSSRKCILERLEYSSLCYAICTAPDTIHSSSKAQYLFSSSPCFKSSFCPWHGYTLLSFISKVLNFSFSLHQTDESCLISRVASSFSASCWRGGGYDRPWTVLAFLYQ